jgi:hypothetical protein
MKFSFALITYLHYMSSKIDWHFIMYLCIVCAQESIADLDKWLVDPSIIDITKSADCDDAWCDNCDIPNINRWRLGFSGYWGVELGLY